MIVRCPSCRRGYRLDDQLTVRRRTLRCKACGCRFTSETSAADGAETSPPAAPPPAEPDPEAKPSAAPQPLEVEPEPAAETSPDGPAEPPPGAPSPSAPAPDGGPCVVLADAGRPFRGVVQPLLEEMGCAVDLATEGMEAFRLAVVRKPALLIASVHLPGLSGVAICEGVKGSPHLKSIKVALVGSSLSSDLFNSSTARAYGADLFLEEGMSKDALSREIAFLLGVGAVSSGGAAGPRADEPEAAPGNRIGPDAEIGMLARLMLSDLRLYYPDRYERAVRDGNLFEVFSDELSKGRAMLDERYPQVAERHRILAAALKTGVEGKSRSESATSSSGRRTN
ncbi:MAG TPA: zinc-ribbon domain-containing protein [Candidatus Cryosericum sp.]|nr:zinc-ribbon domain-containing protein [Candidatus Cryosericum sp.]